MFETAQGALSAWGIDDQLVAVGQFYPRGHTGGGFAGGMIGGDVGGRIGGLAEGIGLAAGYSAGTRAHDAATGLPENMLVGASASTVYGLAVSHRNSEPSALVFQVLRDGPRGEGPSARERARARADRVGERLAYRARGQPPAGHALEGRDRRAALRAGWAFRRPPGGRLSRRRSRSPRRSPRMRCAALWPHAPPSHRRRGACRPRTGRARAPGSRTARGGVSGRMKAICSRPCSPWKIDPPLSPKIRSRSGGASTSWCTSASFTFGAWRATMSKAALAVLLPSALGPAGVVVRPVLGEHRHHAGAVVGERGVHRGSAPRRST